LGYLQNDPEFRTEVPGLEEWVYDLAEKDPKNSVRSAAIDLLAVWDPNKYQNTFLRLANEPSYLVAGSALMGLVSANEPPVALAQIERFEADANYRMTIPVSEYFISQSIPAKGKWFLDRLDQLSGEGLYFFMGYLSEYFSRFPEEGKEEAIDRLLWIMEKNSKNFVRLGAFQALLGFSDYKEVVDQITRIGALEKDPNLTKYYIYFLETLK
jgi:aminopeptidase N